MLSNGNPKYAECEDMGFKWLQLDRINGIARWMHRNGFRPWLISVFVGLVSIALSYCCVKDND